MTTVYILIAILGSVLAGVALAIFGVFCYVMIGWMRSLRESVIVLTSVMQEAVKLEADSRLELKQMFQKATSETGVISRGVVYLEKLTLAMPEWSRATASFDKTMQRWMEFALLESKRKPEPSEDQEGRFIPFDENVTVAIHARQKAEDQRTRFNQQDLDQMRTDQPAKPDLKVDESPAAGNQEVTIKLAPDYETGVDSEAAAVQDLDT